MLVLSRAGPGGVRAVRGQGGLIASRLVCGTELIFHHVAEEIRLKQLCVNSGRHW